MPYMVKGDPAPGRPEGALSPDESLPRVCVIGAGCAGLAAAKALYEARIPFDCFEKGSRVGGMWVYDNPNGMSGCYRTLEMNTSGPRMSYSDFPAPGYYRDYPMHWQVAEYFDSYVDHFGFRGTITFDTTVERAARRDDGVWEVRVSGTAADGGEEVREYDAVLVGNGHHWNARWPEPSFPGSETFAGEQIHAHDYRDAQPFTGKRVLVVGVGNSGVDIACATSYVADEVFLSARRGVHVLRKWLFGKPIDQRLPPTPLGKPGKRVGMELLRKSSGSVSEFGFPEPDHRVGDAHPTLSQELYDRLADGSVKAKPNIRELDGEEVVFEDGTRERIDVIVYCTGYNVTFPFFDEDFISAPGNDLPLFRRIFHPEIDGVYFLGLLQPLGAIMPLAEEQGKWIADHVRGLYALPAADELRADMAAEREANAKRFYRSDRHTMEVDFDEWLIAARKERRRGARRAAAGPGERGIEKRAGTPGRTGAPA
jgi:cation diffusion facilitator CzcD-associated flavoprotein CzcO